MSRKRFILPLICVLLLSACGISQNAVDSGGSEPAYHAQALKTSVSLQEAVETFYYIAVVEMDSDPKPAVNQGYWQWGKVAENIHGVSEDRILLRTNEKEYLKGKQYLLFMSKNESVFYEKQFYSCGRSVYQTERGLFADSIKGLDKMTEKDILEAVKQQVRVTKYRMEAPIRDAYIHSDDKELIFREAAFVVKGLVKAVEQTADDRVMATVKIEYAYKGSLSGTIRAIVPLGAVEIGQTYILALSAADSLFVIAAPHSVYPPSEENIDLLSRCYGTN